MGPSGPEGGSFRPMMVHASYILIAWEVLLSIATSSATQLLHRYSADSFYCLRRPELRFSDENLQASPNGRVGLVLFACRPDSCHFGNGHTPRILLVCSYLGVVNSRRGCFQSSPKNQGAALDAGPGDFAAACSTSTSPCTCPPRCDNPPAGNCRSSGNVFPDPSSLTGRFEPSP